MPKGFNGLERVDENAPFKPGNCLWVKKNQGRPALNKKPRKPIKPRGGFKNPKAVCVILEKDLLDFIKKQALQQSMNQGVYIEPNQLIREALIKAFPTPKQYDMFGGQK